MARTSPMARPAGGDREKCVDPSTPDSSPEKATNTMSTGSGLTRDESWRAISRTPAVPEALSSAPT